MKDAQQRPNPIPVVLDDPQSARTHTRWSGMLASQVFWVVLATIVACIVLSLATSTFATSQNLFNVTRNFAFVAIVALGMMAVIVTGGIDISVGSTIGLSGVVLSVVMNAGYPLWAGIGMGLLTAGLVGLVNGFLIAYLNMQPFVVTLGMLSVGRSLALVISRSRTIFDFGPDGSKLLALGGGSTLGVANPVWFLVVLALLFWFAFGWTRWGRYVFAVGGNRHAANLTGVPVRRVICSVYVLAGLMAGVAAILEVGWLGAVTTGLGTGDELRVIAATVIGGTNLMGGMGSAFGTVVGAALIEVIRNSLILLGVDSFWQGTVVGSFIIVAVLFNRLGGDRQTD
ncbi:MULTISPECIES: ABC transporter permease [unclassified Caballeronia]|uniref:ABC transporter permease n=1 Tax=unclassified Caballeronia TaxID=2646786 RepID=UPI0028591292|nr:MULTISPECIES: ABC transporter permease [unclassified Caballeronia]MDR5825775.1 ABC transporter permease [Caballeronia sp. LZ043]MDR5835903.1 ABC transporter permease [Caballeronia sp. LZ034LL]MDR5884171.1 ABC transporter permease [Caballeronia sp. LZ032]